MNKSIFALVAAGLAGGSALAQVPTGMMGPLRPDQQQFHELYKELVETDTSLTTGNCTTAAEQIAARLERLKAEQGWGAWPACSAKLGLR